MAGGVKMKPREQNSHSCSAESVAAMTLIGAIAQSLALLGPKYEAAVYSALDAAENNLPGVVTSDRYRRLALEVFEAMRQQYAQCSCVSSEPC
jgi:hypothetical protein